MISKEPSIASSPTLTCGVVTLFPELIDAFVSAGILARATARGLLRVCTVNPRDFTVDKHRTVDDAPYGGGSGMVMMPGPIVDALDGLDRLLPSRGHRVLLTPQGKLFTHADACRFARTGALSLVCGRYEGVDERVRGLVDEEMSMGDFVLLGGEVAAMAVIEATARLVPGVLGNEASPQDESHASGLLEYPQYTRPVVFRGTQVPPVLRSGDHGAIARYRRKEALRRTRARRPDLLAKCALTEDDRVLLVELEHEADA